MTSFSLYDFTFHIIQRMKRKGGGGGILWYILKDLSSIHTYIAFWGKSNENENKQIRLQYNFQDMPWPLSWQNDLYDTTEPLSILRAFEHFKTTITMKNYNRKIPQKFLIRNGKFLISITKQNVEMLPRNSHTILKIFTAGICFLHKHQWFLTVTYTFGVKSIQTLQIINIVTSSVTVLPLCIQTLHFLIDLSFTIKQSLEYQTIAIYRN